jgi:hypothetical protein
VRPNILLLLVKWRNMHATSARTWQIGKRQKKVSWVDFFMIGVETDTSSLIRIDWMINQDGILWCHYTHRVGSRTRKAGLRRRSAALPPWSSYILLCIKILVAILIFSYNFDHLSYSKNCASTIYFVCYIFYCKYLLFHISAIIFWIRRIIKVVWKNQQWQIFWCRGSVQQTEAG